jgi:hypothetical protein
VINVDLILSIEQTPDTIRTGSGRDQSGAGVLESCAADRRSTGLAFAL